MEWVVLLVWILIMALAPPIALAAIFGRISLGIQALAALAGLGLLIAICVEWINALAWILVGVAGLGALMTLIGAIGLASERDSPLKGIDVVEEQQAGLAGAQMMLFLAAMLLSILLALNVGRAG